MQRLSGAFAACGAVGATVVALGVGAAVSGAFAACGAVGATVVALGVGAAVSGSLSAGAGRGDVVIVECHADPLFLRGSESAALTARNEEPVMRCSVPRRHRTKQCPSMVEW